MILSEIVLVGINGLNIHHYENLGYEIQREKDSRGRVRVKRGTKILVKVKDLMKSSQVKVSCQCEDCGFIRMVQYDTLNNRKNSSYNKTGETLCQLCANKRMSGVNSGQYKHGNILYPQYRNNARRRNIEFSLTIDQFESLIPSTCFYCGDKSMGIDRMDSSKGYKIDNCVPCCSKCNFIKNTTSFDNFIIKIKNMYDHLKQGGLI